MGDAQMGLGCFSWRKRAVIMENTDNMEESRVPQPD